MNSAIELGHLDSQTFEQMVNSIALRVLGPGLMSFGLGADGGRDGYFRGSAPYPSRSDRWTGRWYIQSKFLRPAIGVDPNRWLIAELTKELQAFTADPRREWPDIWIIATNIEPSGVPRTGTFDKALALVQKYRPGLAPRFDIWGGKRILDYLTEHKSIADRYGHFLTPGNVLARIISSLSEGSASSQEILSHLIADALLEDRKVRLEQAGETGARADLHRLFVDVPLAGDWGHEPRLALAEAAYGSAEHYLGTGDRSDSEDRRTWRSDPRRAQSWLILAGPGTGKTTIGQFLCQIHRAALLLGSSDLRSDQDLLLLAESIKARADELNAWPTIPRIPIRIDLSQYASWHQRQDEDAPRGVLSYIAQRLSATLEKQVSVGALHSAIEKGRWLLVCDGLDEVPSLAKGPISDEILRIHAKVRNRCDLFLLCTSRPQGYAGQLKELEAAHLRLLPLGEAVALETANRLLQAYVPQEAVKHLETLANALKSQAVKQLMMTPLQVHIMSIIVKSGQRPPEKKWELFKTFYNTIYKREASKPLAGAPEAALLRDESELILAVHRALGFVLHVRAETTEGSQSSLPRDQFRELVQFLVQERKDSAMATLTEAIENASTERLVLINTPESKELVRFDVRQLQEFFAGEFIAEGVVADEFGRRLFAICHHSHWREVLHFCLSAVVDQDRYTELVVIVDVLTRMNETSLYGEDRTLGRLLLPGSIAAANLLADGVLEPDRRVRNRFSALIRQLGAAKELFQIQPLLAVRGEESKNWLVDLMWRYLEEVAPHSAIGATVVLFLQSTEGWTRIIEQWARWNDRTREAALRLLARASLSVQIEQGRIYKLLCSPLIGAEAGLLLSGGHSKDLLPDTASYLANDLKEIFISTNLIPNYKFDALDYGWFAISNPLDTPGPSDTVVAKAQHLLKEGCSGYFRFCMLVIAFCRFRAKNVFVELLRECRSSMEPLTRRMLTVNGYDLLNLGSQISFESAAEHVSRLSEDEFSQCLTTGDFGAWRSPHVDELYKLYSINRNGKNPKRDFNKIKSLPSEESRGLAYALMANPGIAKYLARDERLQGMLRRHVKLFLPFPNSWSVLRDALQEDVIPLLRAVCRDLTIDFDDLDDPQRGRPIQLELPRDHLLLCAVATSLVNYATSEGMHDRSALKSASSDAGRWVDRVESLENLFNADVPAEVRVAAAIIGMLHVEGGLDFIERNSATVLNAIAEASSHAALALVHSIDVIGGLTGAASRRMVEQAIELHPMGRFGGFAALLFSRSLETNARSGVISTWLGSQRGQNWLIIDPRSIDSRP